MLKHRFITTKQRHRHYCQSSETSCEDLVIASNLNKYSKSYSFDKHQHSISPVSLSFSTVCANKNEDISSPLSSLTSSFIGCFSNNKWSTPMLLSKKHQFQNNFHSNNNDDNDCDHNFKTTTATDTAFTDCRGQIRIPRRQSKQFCNSSEVLMRRWNSFHSTRGEYHPNRFRQNRKSVVNVEQGKSRKFSTTVAKCYQDVNVKHTAPCSYYNISDSKIISEKKSSVFNLIKNKTNDDNNDIVNPENEIENVDVGNRKKSQQSQAGMELRCGKSLVEDNVISLKTVQSQSSASPSLFCFGKRNGGSFRRPSECFVLETSEMIVIDYPESQVKYQTNLQTQFLTNNENSKQLYISTTNPPNVNASGGISLGDQCLSDKIVDCKIQSRNSSNLQCDVNSTNFLYNSGITDGATISINNEFLTQQKHQENNSNPVLTTTNTIEASIATNNHTLYYSKVNTFGGGGNSGTTGHTSIPFATSNANNLVPTSSTTTIKNMDHHHLRQPTSGFLGNRPELYQKCNRGSHSSDTSSAYSGSDTMTSVHSSSLDVDEVDLSGLVESVVDSDEEDLAESMDSLNVRDAIRDCLEKDPSERTEDDIETLLDFTQTLKAFTNMTLSVRRALCSVMVFAVVDKAGTMVMSDGEELDSWSVLINGHVEIEHSNGEKEELQVGDSFGILPTMDKLYHRGVMRTKCDDCQFVCITQTDYYRIQHQGVENIKKHEEDGKLVMITELRHIGGPDAGTTLRRGHIVIRGTPERLMLQLIEENSMTDPTFVEDFLLTHRTFISNPQEIAKKLLQWFENEDVSPQQTTATSSEIRDRVTRVILLWVNNHFTDFETDTEMMKLLENFEANLEKKNMHGQLRLLHIACAAKARTRNVTLTRSSRDEDLHFTIIGGYERGNYGIFISKVDKKTKAEDVGLKRGDQILEVNGQSFEHVTYNRAIELIMSSTHLSITVRSNLLAFKEMLQAPDNNSPRSRQNRRRICVSDIAKMQATVISDSRTTQRLSTVELLAHDTVDCCQSPLRDFSGGTFIVSNSVKKEFPSSISSNSSSSNKGFMTLGPKRRIQKALIKMNLLPKNFATDINTDNEQFLSGSLNSVGTTTSITSTMTTNSRIGSLSSISHTNNCNSNNNNHQSIQAGNGGTGLYHSHSNPDLTNICYEDNRAADYPEHVLKVYKSDQTCKYLLINKETTAHEVVMLALQEFGIHETSSNFSLCEVSVGEGGMIKQRRLPEQLQNLAERIGLCSRYYLKTNGITETLVPDEMAPELIRESTVHFLQLNANEVAIQLTLQDFSIFRQIESTEYVDDLFELKSKYGTPMLKQFAELVNREMFWVVTEVCSEHNMVRRMKIIKQFIKIARHCKECRNFNSMFAIISGLGHAAVSRLRQTWEKLPSKYQKLFTDLQDLMDPSRNMSKYRQLVSAELLAQHPIIPFYPVVKKDLTFIHLGNDTLIDNLINFEKLRMIAKEVRLLTHMCSSTYDLLTMLEYKGQAPSSAMLALNQMAVSVGSCTLHGQVTVKRRKKSAAAPNPKKMFEEAQMVRRVKAYLNNMKLITDEELLHTLSLECEPGGSTNSTTGNTGGSGSGNGGGSTGGGSTPNSVTIRKRHPSPTLSTTSSTSSTSEGKKNNVTTGPKFGAASPQAVKKLLSLSEQTKTRPHQPKHPGIPLPLVAHSYGLHHALHHTSVSPSSSPGAHRRMGSGSSAGSGSARTIHERSHSDTPTPLPSVDLSVESSSVTSLSNLPLRKSIISGSVTSSDSGHSSCVLVDTHSNCSENTGLYHVASSIVHNAPSPTLQQRRHSSINVSTSSLSASTATPPSTIIPPHYQLHMPLNSNFQQQHKLQHHQQQQQQSTQQLQQFNHSTISPPSSTLFAPSSSSSLNHSSFNKSNSPNFLSQNTTIMTNSSNSSILNNNNNDTGSSNNNSNMNLEVNVLIQATGATNGQCLAVATNGGRILSKSDIISNATSSIIVPPSLNSVNSSVNSFTHQQQQQQSLQCQATRGSGHNPMALPPLIKGPRHPPAYSVAAQMARLHRLGRAHSHEGVTSSSTNFYHIDPCDDDDDDAQVSAV